VPGHVETTVPERACARVAGLAEEPVAELAGATVFKSQTCSFHVVLPA